MAKRNSKGQFVKGAHHHRPHRRNPHRMPPRGKNGRFKRR